jgi:hypothetical protein
MLVVGISFGTGYKVGQTSKVNNSNMVSSTQVKTNSDSSNKVDNVNTSIDNNKNIVIDSQLNNIDSNSYYGIVDGDGKTITYWLKVGDKWTDWKTKSDYVGTEVRLITTDRKLTTDNYTQSYVLDSKVIDSKNSEQVKRANEAIKDYNNWLNGNK